MAFTNPEKNLESLLIGEEMEVIDIGAGSGAYTLAAAAKASNGKVYAFDVQKDLLLKIKAEGAKRHLHNIETIWGDAEEKGGTKLKDASIDVGIISNLLFQIEHKEGLALEVARIIRKKGRLLIIDWTDSFGGLGPAPKDIFPSRLAKSLFEKSSFKTQKEFDAGDHHYGVILERV